MATRITPARRAPEASNRKPRQRAAAPVATSLDLQAAVRAAVREVLVPDAKMKPAALLDTPQPARAPTNPLEEAISQTSLALDELTATVQGLTERLERTVLVPGANMAAPDTSKAEAVPSMGASPVLHQITGLHARIRYVNECVHDIGNRLEA